MHSSTVDFGTVGIKSYNRRRVLHSTWRLGVAPELARSQQSPSTPLVTALSGIARPSH